MKSKDILIKITQQTSEEELTQCSQLMHSINPWVTLGFSEEKCKMAMQGDYKEIFIAQINDEFVGFVVIQLYGVLRGYIQTLAVVPRLQGHGIGTALISHCEKRILREYPNVFICVSSFNNRALQLYLNLGYVQIGTLKDYIVTGYDEIILRKSTVPYQEFKATN